MFSFYKPSLQLRTVVFLALAFQVTECARAETPSSPAKINGENAGKPSMLPLGVQRGASMGRLLREFITETQKLAVPINTTATSQTDYDRIDKAVEEYRALVDRVTDGRFDTLPRAQKQPMLMGLKALYDGAAANVAQEIEATERLMADGSGASAAYHILSTYDVYLYAARKLFPDEAKFNSAHLRLVEALDEMGGTRAAALAKQDEVQEANARKVRMPAAITQDKGAQSLFRAAWKTSGIPWQIMKINITSGWRDKVEYGRVVGQRRDAAIAARDPANPDRCNLYDFTLLRDRSGSVRRDSHSTTRIACENVK